MSGYPVQTVNTNGFSIGNESDPLGTTRSEVGVGALMPWNGKLYYATYLATPGVGSGTVIGTIDKSGQQTTLLQTNSVHAGRFVHKETNQMLMGPCIFELDGTMHVIANLVNLRVTGWARHLTFPLTKMYAMTMEGAVYEVDLTTYANATLLGNYATALGLPRIHGKACWTVNAAGSTPPGPFGVARLWVASNVDSPGGVMATTADGANYIARDTNCWIEVTGSYTGSFTNTVYCIGNDHRSALFGIIHSDGTSVTKYRLPKRTRTQNQYITQEWMRVRQVQTERFMANIFGNWFQVSQFTPNIAAGGPEEQGTMGVSYPIVEAVAPYLETITDFTVWNGKFVVGTNNVSEQGGGFPISGQSQSCIKFSDMDDIFTRGKPTGKGHLWYHDSVTAGVASDAMLMRGFDKKCIHFYNATATPVNVDVTVIDVNSPMKVATVAVAANSFASYVFPEGFGADWFTLKPDANITNLTAWVNYS